VPNKTQYSLSKNNRKSAISELTTTWQQRERERESTISIDKERGDSAAETEITISIDKEWRVIPTAVRVAYPLSKSRVSPLAVSLHQKASPTISSGINHCYPT
jgi:hypothetical protein